MEIGIGLPATIPGVDGESLVEWARRAERHGFSTLGTIDRLVYPNYDPLIAFAAAAVVTERIRLTSDVILYSAGANMNFEESGSVSGKKLDDIRSWQ